MQTKWIPSWKHLAHSRLFRSAVCVNGFQCVCVAGFQCVCYWFPVCVLLASSALTVCTYCHIKCTMKKIIVLVKHLLSLWSATCTSTARLQFTLTHLCSVHILVFLTINIANNQLVCLLDAGLHYRSAVCLQSALEEDIFSLGCISSWHIHWHFLFKVGRGDWLCLVFPGGDRI